MNLELYQKLIEFSLKIDPTESDFQNKTKACLKEMFGFQEVVFDIFTDKDSSCFDMPESFQEEQSGKVIFLKNEKKKCIGLLFFYDAIKPGYKASKEDRIIDEIVKIIEKALQIYLCFYNLKVNYSILQNMISKLPIAIILCDSNFHILSINQAAEKILKLINCKESFRDAESIIKNEVLPNYLKCGLKEYSLSAEEYDLGILVQNHIIHNLEKDTYITCYQITINCSDNMPITKWNEFLISKELTKRECEISNFMRLAYTNEEIASNLHISINTMKRHRESIYRKLNINRMNQLNVLFENIRN